MAVKITFESGGAQGFLPDQGQPFSQHLHAAACQGFHSCTYGWKCDGAPFDNAASTRTWGTEMDATGQCSGDVSWELQVRNGAYKVQIMLPNQGQATSSCEVNGGPLGQVAGTFVYEQQITVACCCMQSLSYC